MALGTDYYENYGLRGRPTIDRMRISMATVVSNHSLGVLVIDEIQNLRDAKSEGAARMLNFFVQLDNTIGVPVILVGTPKALPVLTGEFRRARRATGQGDVPWERMQRNDEWRFFLETVWKYLYVRKPSPLTDELSNALYDEAQGITDIAIKLFFLAQIRAIVRGEEEITVANMKKTAEENLGSVQKFLSALRTNNPYELRKYEDIKPINLEQELQKARESIQTTHPKLRSKTSDTTEPDQGSEGVQAEQKQLTSEVTQQDLVGGLLEVVTLGKKRQLNAYEALKQGGFIRSAKEYLTEDVPR